MKSATFEKAYRRGAGDGTQHTTLAWSLWHLFRIEDIVVHTLILKDEQVLIVGGWLSKTKSPVITTANELDGDAMIKFSKSLDIKAVYEYCQQMRESGRKFRLAD